MHSVDQAGLEPRDRLAPASLELGLKARAIATIALYEGDLRLVLDSADAMEDEVSASQTPCAPTSGLAVLLTVARKKLSPLCPPLQAVMRQCHSYQAKDPQLIAAHVGLSRHHWITSEESSVP